MHNISIDGNTRNTSPNSFWRGFGFISANNSSRLLMDYKTDKPDVYKKILSWLFDPNGAVRMSHIKIEMGADINSSSGTEPSTKRSVDEPANVKRGAGFDLAADALKINPDITLELLSWGVPGYILNAPEEDKFPLRYAWFKETLDAAYHTYGIRFSYIDPNINERAVEKEWIKYFSAALKSEKNTPYPYGDIKIVAADEEAHYNLALDMLNDPELMNAVDVIGIHYISTADENTLCCKHKYGKELWYSEGLSPANISQLTVNADGSGISGVNSVLDVAGRIVNMYPNGGFTMYEFQPAVAAYYSGVCYYPKQLIKANEPWSGHIEAGSGMYMAAHFGAFAKKGWLFVDSACFGDGTEREHVLSDTTNNYLTLSDPNTDDYSVIFVNHTDLERRYRITVKALKRSGEAVHIWETRGPDKGGAYDSNYFKHTGDIRPEAVGDGHTYDLTVKPFSLVTVSTLDIQPVDLSANDPASPLQLHYYDDFEYNEYGEEYLASRGGTPRYTTDLGGAFEVIADSERGHVLRQTISKHMKGSEWGFTPTPVTSLGDDSWANYTVSADVRLEENSPDDNYAGIGSRYINGSAENSMSGYRLVITPQGKWQLCRITEVIAEGSVENFDLSKWHRLSMTADNDTLSCSVDGEETARITLDGEVTFSGRAALYSAYYLNDFDDLRIEPADGLPYIVRVDDLDNSIIYNGSWKHTTMDSFTRHNRTASENIGEGGFEFGFEGGSLAVIGTADNAMISVSIDGKTIADRTAVRCVTAKAALWHSYAMEYGSHRMSLTVHSGTIKFDALEYGKRAAAL